MIVLMVWFLPSVTTQKKKTVEKLLNFFSSEL